MARLLTLIAALTLLLGMASTVAADDPEITYQRIHSLVASHDNRITLRVWEDGRMEMRYPVYTSRAGHYRHRLLAAEKDELASILSTLPETSESELLEQVRSARGDELFLISDADRVVFHVRHVHRSDIRLNVPGPDALARAMPGIAEVEAIVSAEKAVHEWMDRQRARAERLP